MATWIYCNGDLEKPKALLRWYRMFWHYLNISIMIWVLYVKHCNSLINKYDNKLLSNMSATSWIQGPGFHPEVWVQSKWVSSDKNKNLGDRWTGDSKLPLGVNEYVSVCVCDAHPGCIPAFPPDSSLIYIYIYDTKGYIHYCLWFTLQL